MTLAATGRVSCCLVRASSRRPRLTAAASLLLAALGLAVALHGLTFRPDTIDLLPPDARYVERWRAYERDFAQVEDIVVAVEAPTLTRAAAYAERLHQALRASPVAFPRVAYRTDLAALERRGLLYLPLETLRALHEALTDHRDLVLGFAREPGLVRLVEEASQQIAAAIARGFLDLGLNGAPEPLDPAFLTTLVGLVAERLQAPAAYRSPWGELFGVDGTGAAESGYFLSDDGRLLFVLIETPPADLRSFTMDRAAIEAIRHAVRSLGAEFPDVEAGVTGGPALAHDEMTSAFQDSGLALALALVLILAVMIVALRRVAQPVLVLATLAVSLAWSVGVTTLLVGHLTLFSVIFIPLAAAIGIDYGIYFLCRYREELDRGRARSAALQVTAARVGPAIALGGLTAAGTFGVLALTDFPGIQELGIVAGSAILLACLATLTLLPALLTLLDRPRPAPPADPAPGGAVGSDVPLIAWLTRRPGSVLAAAAAATIAAVLALPFVGFDENLLNLQAPDTESIAWQRRMQASSWRTGLHALASADSLAELDAKQAAFERLPTVYEVESVRQMTPADQGAKIHIVRAMAPLVAPVQVGSTVPVDLPRLGEALRELERRISIVAREADAEIELAELRQAVALALRRLATSDRVRARAMLANLQAELRQDLAGTIELLQQQVGPEPLGIADLPEDLRRRYVSAEGRFLLVIHPRVDAWEREGSEAFVGELRSVDPAVTGPAVINREAIATMQDAWRWGTFYAYLLVAVLSYVVIGRVRETALALLPLVLGLVWTLGLMRLFGVSFTLANVFALPLLVGACAEFGLNIVLSHLGERETGRPRLARSAVTGVFLNGLTTMVGFGSLMVADHRGIFGLGLLLTLGAAARLLASLVVLPVLLHLFPSRAAGRAPAETT